MLLKEFTLPPTVVQSAIRRPPIQANNLVLKIVTLQMFQNILFHGLPNENPNMHLTNFIKICDTIKYSGVIEEALKLRLFLLSLGNKFKHWLTSQPNEFHYLMKRLGSKVLDKVLPAFKDCTTGARHQYF